MWYPYCIMSLCSGTFYFLLLSPVINVVITPSDVTDVTVWPITFNPNPRVLKIKKLKINWKKNKNEQENKKKQSPLSVILTLITKWTTCLFVISESWMHFQRFRSDLEVQ